MIDENNTFMNKSLKKIVSIIESITADETQINNLVKSKDNNNNKGKGKGKGNLKSKNKNKGKSKNKNGKQNMSSPNKIIDSCGCSNNEPDCCSRKTNNFRQNDVPSIITSTDNIQRNLVMRNTMPQISRLFQPIHPITNKTEESKYLYPSSYGGPPGPACNWRKCSNKGGCGTECVCHPAGKYGWRCIPKCCIGRDGYPPCRFIYDYDVMCTLPCSTWPGLCQENFWNPYHTYQGPYAYPNGQSNLKPLYG